MKVYRSVELGALELKNRLGEKRLQEAGVEIHSDPLEVEELLRSDFDLIELTESQSQSIISHMTTLDWQIQSTQAADAFSKEVKGFKPLQLGSSAFGSFLESKHITLDVSKNAVLVGGYSFLMTYAVALAKLGFNKIYLVSPNDQSYQKQIANIQKYLFDVKLYQLTADEMANVSELASLLIIDFKYREFPEMVETLTYFNFLAENAIFFDLQNFINSSLSTEAEKASLKVLDSANFHLHKYRLFQKNRK